jgi:hypothetical protein
MAQVAGTHFFADKVDVLHQHVGGDHEVVIAGWQYGTIISNAHGIRAQEVFKAVGKAFDEAKFSYL